MIEIDEIHVYMRYEIENLKKNWGIICVPGTCTVICNSVTMSEIENYFCIFTELRSYIFYSTYAGTVILMQNVSRHV